MSRFGYCKCFYEQNIFIRDWNKHVVFKNERQFREDHHLEDNVEAAVAEATLEIERRIGLRRSVVENRDFVSEHFLPSSNFSKDFDQNFVPAFIEASEAAKANSIDGGSTLPPNGPKKLIQKTNKKANVNVNVNQARSAHSLGRSGQSKNNYEK